MVANWIVKIYFDSFLNRHGREVRQEKRKNIAPIAVEQCHKLTPCPPLFSRREGGTKGNWLPQHMQGGEFEIGSEEIPSFAPVVTGAGHS